jgi:hypothetical protein
VPADDSQESDGKDFLEGREERGEIEVERITIMRVKSY